MTYKQSSVDFYAEKSLDLFNLFQHGSISINDFRARMLIIEIEAKEMGKEQIKNAWYDGYLYEGRMPDNECVADTYYKKTYGGKK